MFDVGQELHVLRHELLADWRQLTLFAGYVNEQGCVFDEGLHNLRYREETFALLALNAWELLLKAKLLAEKNNDPKIIYIYEKT